MGRTLQVAQLPELNRSIDLTAPVVYFPVRHHSPACAFHVDRLVRQLRPAAVLVEGPRDASHLIPLLTHQKTRPPLAIYTTYVDRPPEGPPRRHAAYYPLCDYSPELAAIRAAKAVGASVALIDLTFPEMVAAGRSRPDQKAQSLLDEHHLLHSRFLRTACDRAGVRDPDDLWDHFYEVDYRETDTSDFMRRVLAYCAIARSGCGEQALSTDGTLVRERAMKAQIQIHLGDGQVLVVSGGFHTVALPDTQPAMPQPLKMAAEDAVVVLMRYGFEQLDRLNGYASGMPSPEFYQRNWDQKDATQIFVDLGREARQRGQEISIADEIAAADQCQRLAQLRRHAIPSREDVLDAIRSAFVKGAADAEGLPVMALARQLLAGERVGQVPPDAGQPPIVLDFRRSAQLLGIALDKIRASELFLDLYRRPTHRQISRLFYRLKFLEIPFAQLVRGPDFVGGKDLERIQEVWKYHWSPETESALIERSLYGASVEEAAAAMLIDRFAQNERHGQGRRADLAAALVLEACRMGLHRHLFDLLSRTASLVSEDQSFPSLVCAIERLLVLQVSREPLEAHSLSGIAELAGHAYERACYLIPGLGATSEQDEPHVLAAMAALLQSVQTLGDTSQRQGLRWQRLWELTRSSQGNAAVRGAALGILYGDGQCPPEKLAQAFRGHLSGDVGGTAGTDFLRGLLRTARSALWQVPQLIDDLHQRMGSLPEVQFVRQLPVLRLAFADLTPRETYRVAAVVAQRAGIGRLDVAHSQVLSSADVALAVAIQRRLSQSLRQDGLADWAAGEPT